MSCFRFCLGFFIMIALSKDVAAQPAPVKYWHNKERSLRYHPEGQDFVITNGNRCFTRALYGNNTAFRVEAGDLPEFALYMPGMGGNLSFGLLKGDSSKWLIHSKKIVARYRAGSMIYEIEDPMLGKGKLHLTVLALFDREGVVIKAIFENTGAVQLFWVFGGASGKKFFRDGDMGPDPESVFYLKPENCRDNHFQVKGNSFLLRYGTGVVSEADPYVNKNLPADTIVTRKPSKEQQLVGVVPTVSNTRISDASTISSPAEMQTSSKGNAPVLTARFTVKNDAPYYFLVQRPGDETPAYADLPRLFLRAEATRRQMAGRIKVTTPDPFINTLGSAMSMAADAIWESPTYLHGSIGWRMRLNGWRGPYVGDVLGWHDRARLHFRSYAKSQLTTPDSGKVVADTALRLVRQLEKLGTAVFSSGYISRNPNGDFRAHHYDMNLVYIDALLNHFKWTGDVEFVREMFPVIKRHLAWEKRNFDADGDGLYDAYAAIWASDALQYSGGAGTHSSAYNYRANKMAGELAALVDEDPQPYANEATKILAALNKTMWMPSRGWHAEFKDALGLKKLHHTPALWTIYHSIDSDITDPFQAYQSLNYVDKHIPHIPIKAIGLKGNYQTISTTNWMPYAWSLNNVAPAESMHTALAFWQGGRAEDAFNLWKSTLMESMYIGGSPGNFLQISSYDAARGEAYRDFADPLAMTARSLVEGLFGIQPDLLRNKITINPGFPASWQHAALETPDIKYEFSRRNNSDAYTITPEFSKSATLVLKLRASKENIIGITVNGKKVSWKNIDSAVGLPLVEINCGIARNYLVQVSWSGQNLTVTPETREARGTVFKMEFASATITNVYDPQQVFQQVTPSGNSFQGIVQAASGHKILFIQTKQGSFTWWQPIHLEIVEPSEVIVQDPKSGEGLGLKVRNNLSKPLNGKLLINTGVTPVAMEINIPANATSEDLVVPAGKLLPGTNTIVFKKSDSATLLDTSILTWTVPISVGTKQQLVSLKKFHNDKITNIFRNEYLSPRPTVPTLQLPTQGIGEWTHPLFTVSINDSGLRKKVSGTNILTIPQGIQFETPAQFDQNNIMFTSQWDNYPKEAMVPLTGKASHAYLLMAGSTNPMQTRMDNGAIIVKYMDETADTLLLKNPENWWPIDQDYLEDGYAFQTNAPRPVRVHLKTGHIVSEFDNTIEAFNGKMIDGGAATVLDMPLSPNKPLKELVLQTWANDVVIGLMAITLIPPQVEMK